MIPELVPEGGVPDLVESALAVGDKDAAVQPESAPVSTGHGGSERDQRARKWFLVGFRPDPLVLRESCEQRALRRVAARGGGRGRVHRFRARRPVAGDGGRGHDRVRYSDRTQAGGLEATWSGEPRDAAEPPA